MKHLVIRTLLFSVLLFGCKRVEETPSCKEFNYYCTGGLGWDSLPKLTDNVPSKRLLRRMVKLFPNMSGYMLGRQMGACSMCWYSLQTIAQKKYSNWESVPLEKKDKACQSMLHIVKNTMQISLSNPNISKEELVSLLKEKLDRLKDTEVSELKKKAPVALTEAQQQANLQKAIEILKQQEERQGEVEAAGEENYP